MLRKYQLIFQKCKVLNVYLIFETSLILATLANLVIRFEFVIAFYQVSSYEEAGDTDEEKYMMDAPCMKNLIQLTG